MSKINNTSYLDVTTCDEEVVTAKSNTVEFEVVDLTIEKTANCNWTIPGGTITYCTTITNPSEDVTMFDVVFRDVLDNKLSYVSGSFTVNGIPAIPEITGQEVKYKLLEITPKHTVVICFKVHVS